MMKITIIILKIKVEIAIIIENLLWIKAMMLEIATIMLRKIIEIRIKDAKTDVKSSNENPIYYVKKRKQ